MDFLRRNWVALLFIFALVAFSVNAHDQSVQNNRDSIKRSIHTCRRGNPGRAYLRLRADEFIKTSFKRPSYTTKVSPEVWQILDCKDTVAQHRSIPLRPDLQQQYLRDFRKGFVDKTRGQAIVGRTPMAVYYAQSGGPINP